MHDYCSTLMSHTFQHSGSSSTAGAGVSSTSPSAGRVASPSATLLTCAVATAPSPKALSALCVSGRPETRCWQQPLRRALPRIQAAAMAARVSGECWHARAQCLVPDVRFVCLQALCVASMVFRVDSHAQEACKIHLSGARIRVCHP